MNEVLGKRVLGACVLVVGTLVLANLLPEPQALHPADGGTRRVSFDLQPSKAEVLADQEAAIVIPAAPVVAPQPPQVLPEKPANSSVLVPAPARQISVKPAPKLAKKEKPASPPAPKAAAVPSTEFARARGELVPSTPAAAPAPVPAPAPPAEPIPAPAGTAGVWYVQIGAFAKEANAQTSVEKLQKAGLAVRQDNVTFKAGQRYRVRCGPYASRDEAETQRARAAQLGFRDARIAREPE